MNAEHALVSVVMLAGHLRTQADIDRLREQIEGERRMAEEFVVDREAQLAAIDHLLASNTETERGA